MTKAECIDGAIKTLLSGATWTKVGHWHVTRETNNQNVFWMLHDSADDDSYGMKITGIDKVRQNLEAWV